MRWFSSASPSTGGHILSTEELDAVRKLAFHDENLNSAIVGQSACTIADMAAIHVPTNTQVLIGEVTEISWSEPFAHEKLSPLLALYRASSFEDACAKAGALVALWGMGHTSVLYTDQDLQPERVARFGNVMKTGRILINTPSSQGGIGDLYNFNLPPSMTLGCGSWGAIPYPKTWGQNILSTRISSPSVRRTCSGTSCQSRSISAGAACRLRWKIWWAVSAA